MTADPQPAPEPQSQDILLARLAALTEADAPPDEQDYARWPDRAPAPAARPSWPA